MHLVITWYPASHSYPLCYTQLIVVMMFSIVMFCQVSVSGRLSMVVDCGLSSRIPIGYDFDLIWSFLPFVALGLVWLIHHGCLWLVPFLIHGPFYLYTHIYRTILPWKLTCSLKINVGRCIPWNSPFTSAAPATCIGCKERSERLARNLQRHGRVFHRVSETTLMSSNWEGCYWI